MKHFTLTQEIIIRTNSCCRRAGAGVFEAHSRVSITPTRGEQKCADQDDSDVMLGLKSRRRGADLIHAWT